MNFFYFSSEGHSLDSGERRGRRPADGMALCQEMERAAESPVARSVKTMYPIRVSVEFHHAFCPPSVLSLFMISFASSTKGFM